VNFPKFLTSPLAATAGVIAGLAILAVPLRQVTSATPVAAPPSAEAPATTEVQAWLTLKLLAPADSVTLETATGKALWKLAETPAGDVETRISLPLQDDGLDLTLTVDFGDESDETAAFLTIAPDGLEAQTRHAIGSGLIEEPLDFTWPTD
jgi:hypothetical protein